MREIDSEKVVQTVRELCISSNYNIGDDVLRALERALEIEESPLGKEIIAQILENDRLAREEQVPMCQDTGVASVFVEIGEEVKIKGVSLTEAINKGVRRGYVEGYLRKSVVADPLRRKNTNDNTPAMIHTEIVPGDKLKITILPKGAGSENMSGLKMLAPAEGWEGIKKFVLEFVRQAGSNPCPPIVVGVGIGGTFDNAALLAKKALLRPLGSSNPDPYYADLERELLKEINNLGIGPQGFGGRVTALAVHIETYPCHIASLPVAVNINCHAARKAIAVL